MTDFEFPGNNSPGHDADASIDDGLRADGGISEAVRDALGDDEDAESPTVVRRAADQDSEALRELHAALQDAQEALRDVGSCHQLRPDETPTTLTDLAAALDDGAEHVEALLEADATEGQR